MFILWSSRMSGWLTRQSTYVSTRKEAAVFDHAESLRMCARHHNNGFAEFGLLPISLAMLGDIIDTAKESK